MSEQEEMEQGGTAVKALAAAAATGAATFAVRKALATRNGHADEHEGDAQEDAEYAEDEGEDEPEASVDDGADDEDEDYEDDEPDEEASNGSERPSAKGAPRQLANPSRLASLSHLLVPLAAEAADSAGRYVAEHTSDTVQKQVVTRFIDAFEKAS